MATCAHCEKRVLARGLCGLHYKRFMRGENLFEHNKGNQSLPRGGLAQLGLHKHHPFYLSWVNMKTRCDNPNSTQYYWYGGRGITYDPSWREFANFYSDMIDGWSLGLTLDRTDVNGNYSKDNCCWIPASQQAQNRRPREDRPLL